MKVLYTHEAFCSQRHGGMSRYFVELMNHLRTEGSDLELLVFGGLYINEYLREVPAVAGVKIPPVRNTGILRRHINDIFQRAWLHWHGPAIIHQTYYSASDLHKGAKLVLTVPDMIHELFPGYFSDEGRTSSLKKKSCERANRIISISHTTKKDLETILGIDGEKVAVVHLANPLEGIDPDYEIETVCQHYLLYVGERQGYKNFENVMKAYSGSKAVRESFSLVCFGGGGFNNREKELLAGYGVTGKVHQVSGDDRLLALYYRNARAFIYPSFYEGFGLPLLEAMSCSCPVICSWGGSIPEIAGNAGLYFDPKDPEKIAELLEKCLFDDSLLRQMVVLGKERVKEFSWEKCAKQTLEVYRSLAD